MILFMKKSNAIEYVKLSTWKMDGAKDPYLPSLL